MITTRQINVKLSKRKKVFSRVTTRDVDANIRFKVPTGKPAKKPIVSTNKLGDVADIGEKKRRDDIMAERKAFDLKDKKKLEKVGPKLVEPSEELKEELEKVVMPSKKLWKEMADDEKKIVMAERMAKVRAAKGKKKEEK